MGPKILSQNQGRTGRIPEQIMKRRLRGYYRRLLARGETHRIVPVTEAVCIVLRVTSHHSDKGKSKDYAHKKKFAP